jgi:hypothetical protein
LNHACRKWGAREIRLRHLPKPALYRWIAEALIDHVGADIRLAN